MLTGFELLGHVKVKGVSVTHKKDKKDMIGYCVQSYSIVLAMALSFTSTDVLVA